MKFARVALIGFTSGLVALMAPAIGFAKPPLAALLGSPDFHPSPEQPVGWRGDGTGCFPAADPPLQWYRRPKGTFNSIRVLATRPKGNESDGQPLNMGSVRQWLVAGPFTAKDHATALDDVSAPDEANLQPAAGEDLNGKRWKPMDVSVANQSQSWSRLTLDLALAYGETEKQERQNHPGTMDPGVAYACTYLYSGETGPVRLRIESSPAKAWLNAAPLKIPNNPGEATPVVTLKQGWNCLLIKVASTKRNWNMSTLIYPVASSGYETKNIVWMAPMPGPSWSSPIVVGAKVFINADDGTLVCLNKADGRTLWTRSTTYYDAVSEEDRKAFPELAAKVEQLHQMMETLPDDLNAALSVDGGKAEGNTALREKIKRKLDLERDIRDTMSKSDKVYRTWNNDRGWTTATPVSDGEHVFVALYGGQKGLGGNVVACFDLEGKRIWSHFTGQSGVGEHGTHSTPALSGKYLVHLSGATIFAYDKATGAVVWTQKTKGYTATGASLIALKAGRVDAVYVPEAGIYRTADGAELWKSDVVSEIPTPSLVSGVVFGISGGQPEQLFAFRVPPLAGDAVQPVFLGKAPWKGVGPELPGQFTNTIIGSPLYHNGLFYVVSEGGELTVVDVSTGKAVYTQPLEDLNPRLTWVFRVGISTGPTLAGKYIHIRDDQSQTLVIAPGRKYQELAKNVLWELQPDGNQQESQSNPFYEGKRIYYRTQSFLYCIGEE